jgi:hypothetical protein
MTISGNVHEIEQRISRACERASRAPDEVTLVAVTKTLAPETIEAGYRVGLRDFGENRVQEAKPKIEQLASPCPDITWHMVGHLQSNKAKTAIELFDIIHSVDSLRLAERLNSASPAKLPVLVEVNVACEATKCGVMPQDVGGMVRQIAGLPNLDVRGLMTVAPLVSDPEEVRPVFRQLREMRDALGLEHLSMGMTDDYEVAIEEGATIVRIGRAIFGERKYG